ncbi:MAG: DUF4168 domain-containing protein [Bacteroidota bacterium]
MKFTKQLIAGLCMSLLSVGIIGAQTERQVVQPQQESQESTEVTDAELKEFASVYQKVQKQNQKAQKKMKSKIQEEGLTVERYQKISKAQNNPNAETEVSEEEKAKLKSLNDKFEKMQMEMEEKAGKMIEESDLSMKRYQEIYQKVQQDKALQERFGEMMNG